MSTCRGLNLAIATAVQHTLLDVLVLFIEAVFGRKDLSGVPGTPRMCRKSGRRAPVGGKKMASRIHCRLTRTEGHRSPPFTGHRSPVIGHRETNTKLIIGITFRFGAFLLQHYSSIFVIHHEVRIYSGRGLGENTEKKSYRHLYSTHGKNKGDTATAFPHQSSPSVVLPTRRSPPIGTA